MSVKSADQDDGMSNLIRTAEAIQWLEPFRDLSIAQFIEKFFDDLCASTRERGRKLMSQFAEDATLAEMETSHPCADPGHNQTPDTQPTQKQL